MFVTLKNFQNTYFEPDARFKFFFNLKTKRGKKKKLGQGLFIYLFIFCTICPLLTI